MTPHRLLPTLALALVFAATIGEAQLQPRPPQPPGPAPAPRPSTPSHRDPIEPRLPGPAPPFGRLPAIPTLGAPEGEIVVLWKGSPQAVGPDAVLEASWPLFALPGKHLAVYRVMLHKLQIVLRQLLANVLVEYAKENERVWTLRRALGTDPSGGLQYALEKMRVDQVHQVATGRGVTIAVIDTGVDDRHAALRGKILRQLDTRGVGKAGLHGTALAGIIAAEGRMKGVAPDAALLVIRAFTPEAPESLDAFSSIDRLARALDLAIQHRVQVMNLSFGGADDYLLRLLIQQAVRAGIAVVAAAGNGGPEGPPVYPAALGGVIAVTATDYQDRLYSLATRGRYIAVAAPGVEIMTTGTRNRYQFVSGTSMAAAHVSALVALVLQRSPGLPPPEVKGLLESTAVDLGEPGLYGAGRVDASRAIESLR